MSYISYLTSIKINLLENVLLHIEAILFAANQAVSIKELKACLDKLEEQDISATLIKEQLELLMNKFNDEYYSFELVHISGGYRFLSKGNYHKTISVYMNQKAKRRLSNAAMETLSIIAYKQPITKAEIEQIRGVNCDYSVQKLLEKELISIEGRSNAPGRPILYGTSQQFMDYFGLKSPKDLPKLKDVAPQNEHEIGQAEE